MTGYVVRAIDQMQALHHGVVKLAGAELGVETFGMQVLDLPPGFTDYPEHDHAADGQEEVYVILGGSAVVTVAGDRVPLDDGRFIRVLPAARRRIDPGPEGARVLAIGRPRGASYERPPAFRLGAPA